MGSSGPLNVGISGQQRDAVQTRRPVRCHTGGQCFAAVPHVCAPVCPCHVSPGLGPEAVRFNTYDAGTRGDWEVQSAKYLLRPETVESLFILWRTTKDAKYRERAWAIFQSIEKHCKTPLAYSGVRDVTKDVGGGANWNDSVQSFFFAETLKYLYLIFSSDSTIPLDKYVFSTEAHPFLI